MRIPTAPLEQPQRVQKKYETERQEVVSARRGFGNSVSQCAKSDCKKYGA